MDYKKQYEQALERAMKLSIDGYLDAIAIDDIFPELKESEDERIKRTILELVSIAGNGNQFEEIKDWLEKQGEQTQLDYEHADISQKDFAPIEPKFKVSDWVILPLGIIAHIDSLNSTDYQVTTTDGKICDFKISKQDNYHLWTIQDAKDGDVLACENGWTCIFNCLNDNLFCSHCFMDNEGWFCEDGGQAHTLDNRICGEIHPAIKEQRDLLFAKMKEAGYEWDAEKKELRKIEPKKLDPDKVIEWIRKYWPFSWGNFSFPVDEAIELFKKDFGI